MRLLSNTNGASSLVHLSGVFSAVGPSHTWLNRNTLRTNPDNWAFSKANRRQAQTRGRLPLTGFHLTGHNSFSVPLTQWHFCAAQQRTLPASPAAIFIQEISRFLQRGSVAAAGRTCQSCVNSLCRITYVQPCFAFHGWRSLFY